MAEKLEIYFGLCSSNRSLRFSVRGFGCALFVLEEDKMKQTLSDLWHGNINPISEKRETDDEKTKKLRGELEICYNILWSKLDSEGKQVLDKLRSSHNELSITDTEDSFIQGFSLAVKMMTESLAE